MQFKVRDLLERMGAEGVSSLSLAVEATVNFEDALNPAVSLSGHLDVAREGQKLLISGMVRGQVLLECSRCLQRLNHRLEVRIEEECLLDSTLALPADPGEEIWTQEGIWVLPVEGWIDTHELIRQHAILSLPLRPLCRPDCPGLASPSQEDAPQMGDPRWAVLQEYRRRLEEGST